MEALLAVILAATIEVADTRSTNRAVAAHHPSGKAHVAKPIDVKDKRFPLLDETVVCQPIPSATKPLVPAKGKQPPVIKRTCVVTGPGRRPVLQGARQRAHAPHNPRVANATPHKTAAKMTGKKKASAKIPQPAKKKWVPERVFVSPPVSIGVGR